MQLKLAPCQILEIRFWEKKITKGCVPVQRSTANRQLKVTMSSLLRARNALSLANYI